MFEVIYLGQLSIIDSQSHNEEVSENAAGILGSYGTAVAPLYDSIKTLAAGDLNEDANDTYDVDNIGGHDSFRINGGALQNFDAVATYNATITYLDGSTATVTATVFQDVTGRTYLAPEITNNADQAALTAAPIRSLQLTSVFSNTGDAAGDMQATRIAGDFKAPVDGAGTGETMSLGYTDGQGDRITTTGDLIFGNDGNDAISAEAGNDVVFGGSGQDTIFGGTGNDRLAGGGGDDRLTGGVGNDTFAFARAGGHDRILDFDLGDANGDGFYNDQLDVSDLRTPSGDPVTALNVMVIDDGAGNARLIFPEGESVVLQGVTPAQMATVQQRYRAGIPCFTQGTMILTPQGERRIDDLAVGDRVVTRDNGPQPIAWIGRRDLGRAELTLNPNLAPVRISAGAFGNDRPLLVSPQHGVLLQNAARETLVRATHLARMSGGRVRIARGARQIRYIHLMFDAHQIILSNGLWTESFYPGKHALAMMQGPELAELLALFPALRHGAVAAIGATARDVARWQDLPATLRAVRAA
ncbi:Hint domain-containing protein [Loktanella sp. DJP18]|uniref:Hint domain-containing protein n=1 Tax=Loktanella sp. DJP18 TaxID=3409788 RepID=UPI003BB66D31